MPFYHFEFDTALTTEEVTEKLKTHIRPPRNFVESISNSFSMGGFLPPKKLEPSLIGTINNSRFKVRRDIRYRNSFLPLVHGHITPTPTGAHINVRMFLHPFVMVFMLIWFSGVGSIDLLSLFKSKSSFSTFDFIPLGMFIFGIVLTYFGFFPEALKARHLIENAIEKQN